MPLLTNCAKTVESVSSRPPVERVTPPPATEIPQGQAPCPGDPSKTCLTDAQNADLLRRYEQGERERDRKLCWLLVWFGYPACQQD